MNITYIHHSCFLVETDRFYYLFDYFKGGLPPMDPEKTIFVLSSHGHSDHYNPEIFSLLAASGMKHIRGILSEDIEAPGNVDTLTVSPGQSYVLGPRQTLTTLRSTDLGVAFLLEDQDSLLYHAGDLNDWVWEGESDDYNTQMTIDYREQIRLLCEKLKGRKIDTAFVVLDPRQEKDYARGMCHFLENIPVETVYPMHYWGNPSVMETFLREYPQYTHQIQRTE